MSDLTVAKKIPAPAQGLTYQYQAAQVQQSAPPASGPQQPAPAPQVNPAELQAFLNQVVAGKQDEAEDMLKQNLALALASGTVTDHAKRTFRNITGFQYAVWALDWHMWRMIKKYLPLEEARLQSAGFTTGSWVTEHGEHVTWKRLIDNYQTYIDSYSKWNEDQRNKYWVQEIGGAQRILPMHVLQEFCQPGRPFHPAPNFREEIVLVRKLPDWLSDLSQVGKEFSIWRGPMEDPQTERIAVVGSSYCGSSLRYDSVALISLDDTRSQQLDELIAELRSGTKFPKP